MRSTGLHVASKKLAWALEIDQYIKPTVKSGQKKSRGNTVFSIMTQWDG
jgi:hypothetical protein